MHGPHDRVAVIDDLVEYIVNNLRPLKRDERAVLADVRFQVEVLRAVVDRLESPHGQVRMREHAKGLKKRLVEFEASLKSAPEPLRDYLYWPRDVGSRTWLSLEELEYRKVLEEMLEFGAEIDARMGSFFAMLDEMRAVCDHAIGPGYGPHPNSDPAAVMCARFAFRLMKSLSERKITGIPNAPFHAITALLYRAATGRKPSEAGLKKACYRVIHGDQFPDPAVF
jgi:hypothetical protein